MRPLQVWVVVCLALAACTEPNPDVEFDGAADGAPVDTRRGDGAHPCTSKTFYADQDKDSYGDSAKAVSSCDQPAGYVTAAGDCDDDDPDVHPGQTKFFAEPTAGTKTFDYNCDKVEEQAHASPVSCVLSGGKCIGDGWQSTVPACGEEGKLVTCYRQSGSQGCGETVATARQTCR